MAGFSLKKKIGNVFSAAGHGLNPFDGGQGWTSGPSNQERAAQSIASANQRIQQMQAPRGVLANPQVRQQFVSSQSIPTITGADILSVAKNRATGLGLGATRAATGWAQAAPGLYDLATPGLGTNRFSKGLEGFAKSIDQTAKAEGVGNIYKAGQVGTEGLGFAAPSMIADALKTAPVVSKIASPVARGNAFIDKLAEVSKTATPTQRVASRAVEGLRPSTLFNVAGGVASDLGQTAGKGQDVSGKTVALSLGANAALGVGVPVAGQVLVEGAKKGARVSVKGAKAVEKAVENPAVAELRSRNDFLQKTYDTAPTSVRKEINKQIAKNNQEIVSIKQGGYAKNPFGKNEVANGLSRQQSDFINEYANMLESMGSGNGVSVNPETGARLSNNYRSADIKGKNMTKYDWFNKAKQEIESGKAMYGASDDYRALPSATPTLPNITQNQLVDKIKSTVEPVDKLAGGKKTRGFERNISKTLSNNPTAKEVIEAIPGYKPITNAKTLSKAADAIARNPQAEFARVITKPQLTSANDVATGNLLLRDVIERGDTESAIQLGQKLGIDGTKLGQAVQAYATLKKTTPEGIITYASKRALRAGRELDRGMAGQLIDKAKAIAQMEDGLDKAKATNELLAQANTVGKDWKDTVSSIIAAPRSAMATADLSAPLRQGAVLGTRYPKQFGEAFVDSIKYFANPRLFEKEMYDISQRTTYPLMRSSGLAVEGANGLTGTEEMFMNSILEGKTAKKLGFGHLVAASDRAYSGFLTKLRADVFDKVVSDFSQSGVKLDAKTNTSLAKFINSASGRGSGKMLDKHAGILAKALFSPKLWKSRIDTMNPAYYANLDPVARKLALQSAGTFTATAATILSMAAMAGAKVEQDPRSADFGKIKVGDTRYDILGGHQQNIRLAAQLISGQKVDSSTGKVQTLGPTRGFGKPSRLDLTYQFIENKENPVVALASKALRGTDQVGNPINLPAETAKLAIPLNLQSTWETANNVGSLPKGIAMNVPGTFGIGVQTYGGSKKTANAPVATQLGGKKYGLEQKDDGKYQVTIGDKTVSKDTLASARDMIARDSFRNSGLKSKDIGGAHYYKTKSGDVKSQPKVLYDASQNSAKNKLEMDRALGRKDTKSWLASAQKEVDNLLNKQAYYDPQTEGAEIDKIQLQIENLKDKASKYAGGSTGSKGGRSKRVNISSTFSPISVSVKAPTPIKVPRTRVAVKPRGSGGKGGRIRVTSKKVRLA